MDEKKYDNKNQHKSYKNNSIYSHDRKTAENSAYLLGLNMHLVHLLPHLVLRWKSCCLASRRKIQHYFVHN